jgi:sarcosine oxidase subunit gamma
MVESYLRQTPLTHLGLPARAATAPAGAGVTLGERPHRCQINLRGNASDPAFTSAVRQATGLGLPTRANTVETAGSLAALWLAPDEWLLVGPGDAATAGREAALVGTLRVALAGLHVAITDVSEARTIITVAGPRARDLLAKGTPLDLHPRVFGPGHCAQTAMASANVILRQVDDRPSYELHILNSFADYLWTWLEGGCREYGVAVAAEG